MKNRNILLVEDDNDYAELTAETLRRAGCHVTTAPDGRAALRILEEGRVPVHLVITDVMMDYLSDGFDLAKRLRDHPQTRHIPIVLLTGVRRVYDVEAEVGEEWYPCDAFLEKPVDPHKLVSTVASLLCPEVPRASYRVDVAEE